MTASCCSGGSHILIASFTYRPELDFQGHQSAFSAGIRHICGEASDQALAQKYREPRSPSLHSMEQRTWIE